MDDAVCQCGFAVVDVGDNGKITDMLQAQNINPVESGCCFAKREF
jgi:hypothetical protein